MFREKAKLLADLLAETPRGGSTRIPTSSVKDLRGNRSQAQVALKAGLTQAQLSRIENGERRLSPEVAMKLGPVLGVSPTELFLSEQVSQLNKVAIKGELSPEVLLQAILDLARSMPDSDIGDQLLEALMSVLRDALEKANGEELGARGAEEPDVTMFSAKSKKKPRPDRDSFGRRIDKPFGR